MIGPYDRTTTETDPTLRDRLSHSARIARITLQRREHETRLDRDAARRLTVARLAAGTLL
jgi:YD repeat-containing protein